MDENCIFCRIVEGSLPADRVYENQHVLAFRDIHPVAPVHILVIPRQHLVGPSFLDEDAAFLMAEMFLAVKEIALKEGIDGTGYRLVMNQGMDGGQEIHHMHLHILGGRRLRWPPG